MNESNDDTIETLLRRQFEGPVLDDGFSERVMRHLPLRRRRIAWPIWLGVLIGAAACWICLTNVPLLYVGWRDSLAGVLSPAVIGLWLAMAALSLLALGWGLVESRDR
ncbi:MAG: DUF5056 domain-containing protein [Rudaea sp.]|uniref:DUF5056 domain-containing protein n=1 Tax=unclassified Rudaea TaxID=2627037 RepID=UPI0010F6472B|nr:MULTISPECIES: DUF5056 domain-containing protein [unclassified Rudaea]MBN8885670.1 DUF5056 domain-containing protein [Rudaea sp.]MBQ3301525.1 DUF5056 domain-containing protein [Eggerthellaceae bacterium]MBR0346382.1 DUF5056 domain-containing protein [Rudaea sp.]